MPPPNNHLRKPGQTAVRLQIPNGRTRAVECGKGLGLRSRIGVTAVGRHEEIVCERRPASQKGGQREHPAEPMSKVLLHLNDLSAHSADWAESIKAGGGKVEAGA